ncbi:TPA: hypothetical protein SOK46_002635 [Clostridioides difficile]|nr:hypothetical protein [Clostridioides difficile]HEK5037698.1 hypothetical protein [Clostridioides difficile]HEK8690917.1 hypothetical protein [Clostridioides difficile]
MQTVWNFDYINAMQSVKLNPGKYKLECWGASGGAYCADTWSKCAKGGYAKGEITLKEEADLLVCVGQSGFEKVPYSSSFTRSGYNGGGKGNGVGNSSFKWSSFGGGATDIRLPHGSTSWMDSKGLLSRILVAGGGGATKADITDVNKKSYLGGNGGGTTGGRGFSYDGNFSSGGTQYEGGVCGTLMYSGSFGKGGGDNDVGGGGGWYGGAGETMYGAGGGSGYALTKDSYKPQGYIPTSKYWLQNVVMTTGGNTTKADGYAKITLLQALPFLNISSYNSTQVTFKADHTDPTLLTKIEYFIDYVLKETITTDLTTEKTINYTLEDNALHTLKIVVTDSNNATAEKVLSISKNIMPLPENVNLQDISTKLVEVNAGFKVGKTSIINTLALKNIEASLNNTLVELSEKIKASFDSGDASIEDLTNKLTQANNTIGQLNSKYKVASGSSVVNSCVNKYGFYHGSDYLFLFPGAIQINGLNFVPDIFFTTFELIDSGYFRKFFVFACRGIFTQDFVITAHYHRLETYLKDFKVEGEVLKLNERDVYMDNRGIQLPCQRQGSSFKWQAIKFI